jgi:hypothetical protein
MILGVELQVWKYYFGYRIHDYGPRIQDLGFRI